MLFTSPIAALAATALLLGGLLLVYASWKRPQGDKGIRAPLGWILILLSGWFWAIAGGAVRGQFIALGVLALAAFVLIAVTTDWQAPRKVRHGLRTSKNPDTPETDTASKTSRWRKLYRFLLAGPLAGCTAFALGLALLALGKGQLASDDHAITNYIIFMALAIPVLWSSAMAWALMDRNSHRVLGGFVVFTGLSSLVML